VGPPADAVSRPTHPVLAVGVVHTPRASTSPSLLAVPLTIQSESVELKEIQLKLAVTRGSMLPLWRMLSRMEIQSHVPLREVRRIAVPQAVSVVQRLLASEPRNIPGGTGATGRRRRLPVQAVVVAVQQVLVEMARTAAMALRVRQEPAVVAVAERVEDRRQQHKAGVSIREVLAAMVVKVRQDRDKVFVGPREIQEP
jgi:hypothetical protein